MGNSGVCCGNLEEQKGLMKMGLCMVLVGHVNFLLGALVHGVVLRHFSLQRGQAMESAISNVIALTAGLLGVIIGILTIVLSKNEKNRLLMKTPGACEPRCVPPLSRCEGDEERRLSVRPPERYKPPCNFHPHRSASSGQYRQNLSSSPFNRAALERSSIWI
ncbi:transmembrane protein 54b isoform X3 [Ctenopharyngodon idella]|uniref:transmembrane protein 54b isoform X3 n=1 Tax=Ctenopharyngodon idella TaxID=7959 RepID=UPI00222E8C62|nr:transmembrane protein 54b isoform X3 [Ctenopharyngodon idella]